ncbi:MULTISPECIES: class I SAM-dependent methyltransferase [Chryseobacterium]|uniref:class I SAM-dependent methyltransferase n=1 Tax=Chryseobacterium sp. R2A-55 TaxID=2744445 RepID=UPI001F3EC39E|nr:class I SAM-dependent methyltransferase [Chryseobacterium sp. R2A-55]
MTEQQIKHWNERYSNEDYAYGEEPNHFLKDQLKDLEPGKILFAAEGEGRNAVHAAKNGWEVFAFDLSTEGKRKALKLAEKNKVAVNYQVGALDDLDYDDESFDAVVLIFAHFNPLDRTAIHHQLSKLLKKGGQVILEGFSENHLEYRKKDPRIGGPENLDMLFSREKILSDFPGFETVMLEEAEVLLNEGIYHQGFGSVIRFVAKKI